MSRQKSHKPTDAELNILRVLWNKGPSTVREVQESLSEVKRTGYTTALKLLQIMADKGLVLRDESNRAHVYRPASSEDETQKQLVGDLLERVFGGSAMKLVLHSLTSKRATAEELRQIRHMIDQIELESGDGATQ